VIFKIIHSIKLKSTSDPNIAPWFNFKFTELGGMKKYTKTCVLP
jgi:hypothetical protein